MAFLCPRPGVCRAGDGLCSEGQGTRFPPGTNPVPLPGCVRLSHTHRHRHRALCPLNPKAPEGGAGCPPPAWRAGRRPPAGPAEPLARTQLSGALGTGEQRGQEPEPARGGRGWRPYLQVDEDGYHVRRAQHQPQGDHVVLEERARRCHLGLEGLATFQARGALTASPRRGAPCGPATQARNPPCSALGGEHPGETWPRPLWNGRGRS